MKTKSFITILQFRLFALIDVLFSEKFELTTWNKKGVQTSKTRFCRTEIKSHEN